MFTSRNDTGLVHSCGLRRELITPNYPQRNVIVERVIRTLKEQRVHGHCFESQVYARQMIDDWITFYNQQRPHQAFKMMTQMCPCRYVNRMTQVENGG
ncbi:integrase core domain-containing protein [Stenotrophomonas geniculata]|jgi:putative transposase|uniref:integrase core domain-containing protein n=1 Tax=Stenotrophomonas geniculata TaxID=86188 RepID=UPI002E771CD0|nr:integrase core domain-containing protein [Stenotrophomonas geniculata]